MGLTPIGGQDFLNNDFLGRHMCMGYVRRLFSKNIWKKRPCCPYVSSRLMVADAGSTRRNISA